MDAATFRYMTPSTSQRFYARQHVMKSLGLREFLHLPDAEKEQLIADAIVELGTK